MAGICKRIINTSKAPKAIGAYRNRGIFTEILSAIGTREIQAVIVDRTMYISGQLGLLPDTMQFPSDNAAAQADQALTNMVEILKEGGATFDNIVKTTVLLADIKDFQAVNEVYSKYFAEGQFPARAAYQVANLPKSARVEIEAIAVLTNSQL